MLASTHVTTVNSIALEFFILLFGMTFTRQFGVLAREAGLFSQAVLLRAVESQHAGGICPTGLAKPYARLLRHCFGQQRRQGFYREWPACAAGRFHRGAARRLEMVELRGCVRIGAVLAEEPPHTANGRALEIWRRPYVVLYHHAAGRTWGLARQNTFERRGERIRVLCHPPSGKELAGETVVDGELKD